MSFVPNSISLCHCLSGNMQNLFVDNMPFSSTVGMGNSLCVQSWWEYNRFSFLFYVLRGYIIFFSWFFRRFDLLLYVVFIWLFLWTTASSDLGKIGFLYIYFQLFMYITSLARDTSNVYRNHYARKYMKNSWRMYGNWYMADYFACDANFPF